VAGVITAGAVGALAGLGLLLVLAGLRAHPVLGPGAGTRDGVRNGASARTVRRRPLDAGHPAVAAAAAGVVATATIVVTGWIGAGIVAGLAAAAAPGTWHRRGRHTAEIALVDAVATWTELLRDTIAAAAGLEEAIVATAPLTPEPLAPAVQRLAARLRVDRLADALGDLADDIDHPSADFVVAALRLAAVRDARDLGPLLGNLADCARADAALRRRVWLDRARLRTSVRVIAGCLVVFTAVVAVVDRDYLAPYDTPGGQVALVVLALAVIGSLAAMARLGRLQTPERFVRARPA
jgi:tight adherence protein B